MDYPCPTCKQYKTPAMVTDGIIFEQGKILLVRRKNEPFQNYYALPGGFVHYGEILEKAVVREIWEETGLKTAVDQLITLRSNPDRDPRQHSITAVYSLRIASGKLKAGDDASSTAWFNPEKLPRMAFDHKEIINEFRSKNKITGHYEGWNLSKRLIFCSHSRHYMHASLLICKFVIEAGAVPINSFTNFGYFLYELVNRHDIAEGINNIINRCDEQWVFGPISEGVDLEIKMCRKIGKKIRFFEILETTNPCLIKESSEKILRKKLIVC